MPMYDTHMLLLSSCSVRARPQSLVMSLSALRLRIVIAYIHHPKRSKMVEPSMDDKEEDKKQCHIFINNALNVRSSKSVVTLWLEARVQYSQM